MYTAKDHERLLNELNLAVTDAKAAKSELHAATKDARGLLRAERAKVRDIMREEVTNAVRQIGADLRSQALADLAAVTNSIDRAVRDALRRLRDD